MTDAADPSAVDAGGADPGTAVPAGAEASAVDPPGAGWADGRPAVTGLGVVSSVGHDVPSFTDALRAGRSGVIPLPDGEVARYGAPLGCFDLTRALSARTGLPGTLRQRAVRLAARAPRPVQVAATAALQAWESAGLHAVPAPPHRVALVIAGSNLTSRYADDLTTRYRDRPAYLPPRFALHMYDTDHVGMLSHILGITGEGFTVGGASASGNVAIIAASRLVESGAADLCLVVGAMVELSAMELRGLVGIGAAAGARAGAPFDESHAGFVAGEGAACLVLESAASAAARGAAVLAVLGGYRQRLDANSLADPSEDGEATVMADTIRAAGLQPHQIGYVNAHGTASPLGDRTEVLALRRVFGTGPGTPRINSTKSLVGHCLAAAGVVEAVATVVQLREGFLHPNAGLRRPADPGCRYVGDRAEPSREMFALSNSFGFGGFNSCVLLANPAAGPA